MGRRVRGVRILCDVSDCSCTSALSSSSSATATSTASWVGTGLVRRPTTNLAFDIVVADFAHISIESGRD